MKRFVEGVDRGQSTLFPERLEDWIGDDDPVLSFLNPAFCGGGNIISR